VRRAGLLLLCVFCCGNDTKLLQQAQVIRAGPTLHDLSIGDAVDVGSRQPHRLVCGRDALKPASVRTASDSARHHPIAVGKLILNRKVDVGEGRA
jgi:hypothetical protein